MVVSGTMLLPVGLMVSVFIAADLTRVDRPIDPLLPSTVLETGLPAFVPLCATLYFVAVINKQRRIKKDLKEMIRNFYK